MTELCGIAQLKGYSTIVMISHCIILYTITVTPIRSLKLKPSLRQS
jgi:hypothetical protein